MSGVSIPYGYAATIGAVPGASRVAMLGNNPSIDTATQPEDVWSGAELGTLNGIDHKFIPRPEGVAVSMEVVSSSALDTAAGTGARTVTIDYLDAAYAAQSVVLTLNGVTPVALPVPVRRVNGLRVSSSGTFGGNNAGNLSVRLAGGLGATFAYLRVGNGLARSSLYTVPAGQTLDIYSMVLAINRADTQDRWASFALCIQNAAGNLIKGIELPASTMVPYRQENLNVPSVIVPATSDVWWRCEAVSQNSTNVTGAYAGIVRAGVPFLGRFGLSG